jgi:ribosome-associated translation inhibitor RaiA
MKTSFQFLGLAVRSSWYRLLDQQLDYWQHLATVTAAEVIMERQPQGRPAYRVQVRLEVSGDTLPAEATAPSLKAALLLASQALVAQIDARKARRIARRAGYQHTATMVGGRLVVHPRTSPVGRPELSSATPHLP